MAKKVPALETVKEDKYADYCVENALRTLTEAEEIKKDEKMMGLVSKLADKKMGAISSIKGLRDKYNEMAMEESEDTEEDDDDAA